jgi:hypothetical protein
MNSNRNIYFIILQQAAIQFSNQTRLLTIWRTQKNPSRADMSTCSNKFWLMSNTTQKLSTVQAPKWAQNKKKFKLISNLDFLILYATEHKHV